MIDALRRERDLYLNDPRFKGLYAAEAFIIASYVSQLGLTNVVDLGAWMGVLAKHVLAKVDVDYLAVEAVQEFIEPMLEVNKHPKFTALNRTISLDAELTPFTLTAGATLRTASPGDRDGFKATFGPATSLTELAPYVTESTYLKVDLEGLDAAVVRGIIDFVEPKVIQFEVIGSAYVEAELLLSELSGRGYYVHELNLRADQYVNIATCKAGVCTIMRYQHARNTHDIVDMSIETYRSVWSRGDRS